MRRAATFILCALCILLGGCQSFHLAPSSGNRAQTKRYLNRQHRHPVHKVIPLRAVASLGDENKVEGQDVSEDHDVAAATSTTSAAAAHAAAAAADTVTPVPHTPRLLWWTKSREEEKKALNLGLNASFLAAVVVAAIVVVFGVDSDVSRGWTAGEVIRRVPLDNWEGYSSSLRDNPVLVKACTSGIVYSMGDWVAQTVEGIDLSEIKRGRVLRSALAGLLLHGPLSHVWYDVCEWLFNIVDWNDYWWVAVPKIITDQILWGPTWNAIYIIFLGLLKKDSFETIKEAVTSTALPLVLAGIRLWPLAHLVTYGLIPVENRLLWVDAVEIVWVMILSQQAAEQARSAEATAGQETSESPSE